MPKNRQSCRIQSVSAFKSIFALKFMVAGGTLNKYSDCLKNTLKCLSIGTPKTINFPFVPIGVPIFKHIIIKL